MALQFMSSELNNVETLNVWENQSNCCGLKAK